MSTEIKSPLGAVSIHGDRETVNIRVRELNAEFGANRHVSRADLLAAVAKECDVIIIDRSELPEVTSEPDAYTVGSSFTWTGREYVKAQGVRESAMRYLALAEYLDAHPAVDEADVAAFASLLGAEGLLSESFTDIARRLLATGRIEVKK